MADDNHHISATAHQTWDRNWQTEEGRAAWLEPSPAVTAAVQTLKKQGVKKALDLGCGVGRHALLLAKEGFEVWAADMSGSGLAFAKEQADARKIPLHIERCAMTSLPFAEASFDYVLAWNVIYHGMREVVDKTLFEIRRVLKRGGLFQCTMLSKRNRHFGAGREIAPGVWVRTGTQDTDHSHPHLFCDAAELVEIFQGFEVLSLEDKEQTKPDSYHWEVLAERL